MAVGVAMYAAMAIEYLARGGAATADALTSSSLQGG